MRSHGGWDVTDAVDILAQRILVQKDLAQTSSQRGTAAPRPGSGADVARTQSLPPPRLRNTPARHDRLVPLADIGFEHWQSLTERTIEPNGYYLPDWELAVNASARGRGDALALTAWGNRDGDGPPTAAARLIGLMPAISAWRAYRIPLAALVSADPYGTLGTPLLDQENADEAVRRMMRQARDAGRRALILRDTPLDGPVVAAFTRVLDEAGLAPRLLQSCTRASLDATRDADAVLRDALGPKKLKELRRQRNRLAEHGEVSFQVASRPAEIGPALDVFLALEASGWKAQRGTAMAQDDGDVSFMRRATMALSARGQCEIVTLNAGVTPVASGVVLRHRDRAFWFKLGIDAQFAKMSPGVQLALELTRHLCADPAIAFADSTASPNHPMIDPIWRGRLTIGDVLIPLRPNDPTVAAIRAAMALRRFTREPARRLAHAVRILRERRR
jgi:CelD/BcsL family acetyltransferase involved in cellulose biosynthesis